MTHSPYIITMIMNLSIIMIVIILKFSHYQYHDHQL